MRSSLLGIILLSVVTITACEPNATPVAVLPTLAQYPSQTPQPTEVTPSPTPRVIMEQAMETATSTQVPTDPVASATIATNEPPPSVTPTLERIVSTPAPLIPVVTSLPVVEEAQYADITYSEALNLLNATPDIVLPVDHARQIYERGQQRGLDFSFMLTVGDCNSESSWYLETLLDDIPPDTGVDASYYQTVSVQDTLSFYNDYTFRFKGQSVNSGLNASSVLDPFWANPDICPAGESPLTCDYRFMQPFASLIMFGANDINVLSTAGYEMAMRQIIEATLARDIIPVLSTFSVRPIEGDNTYAIGVRFNGVIVRLAEEYDVPLVNFWVATRTLDDNGILPDNAHLTVTGFNIRNQLTVEILNQIRLDVINNDEANS